MKKYIFIIAVIFVSLASCTVKESCELNDLGNICLTNNTSNTIEVRIDDALVFELEPGETRCSEQNVGEHSVKCLHYPDEYSYDVIVEQCEDREISIPE